MFALFNLNKQFIGLAPDIPSTAKLLKKEIPKEQSDPKIWRWEGDYDNGKMIKILSDEQIEEFDLEEQLFEEIYIKYPPGIQLINIIKQLHKITPIDNMDKDFALMAQSVFSAVENYEKRFKYLDSLNKITSKNETVSKFKQIFGE
jgi:hypothetical protein